MSSSCSAIRDYRRRILGKFPRVLAREVRLTYLGGWALVRRRGGEEPAEFRDFVSRRASGRP